MNPLALSFVFDKEHSGSKLRKSKPRPLVDRPTMPFPGLILPRPLLRGVQLLVGLLLAGSASGLHAQQDRSYAVTGLQVTVVMDEEGVYEVTEELLLQFSGGTFTEGFRQIPMARIGRLDHIQVTSPDVELTEVRIETSRRQTEIVWVFPPHEGDARFVLTYSVEGALRRSEGLNLVDWDAVGSAWSVPLHNVGIRLEIPSFGLDQDAFELRPAPQSGSVLGSVFEAQWVVDSIPAGTPYRIVASFPEQILVAPEPEAASRGRFPWGLLLAFLLGLVPPLSRAVQRRAKHGPVQKQGLEASSLPLPWLTRLTHGRRYWQDSIVPVLVGLAKEGHLTLEPVPDKTDQLQVRLHARPDELLWSQVLLLKVLAEQPVVSELSGHLAQDKAKVRVRLLEQVEKEMEEAGLLEFRKDEALAERKNGARLAVGGVLGSLLLSWIGLLPGPIAGMVFLFSVTAGSGLMLVSLRSWQLTPEGAKAKAEHLAFTRTLRKEILQDLRRRPERAQSRFVEHLDLLLATAAFAPMWLYRVQQHWKRKGTGPVLPPWLASLNPAETKVDDLAPFFPIYMLLWTSSSPGGLAAHGQPANASDPLMPGGVGLGGSGGVGGGGGGFR